MATHASYPPASFWRSSSMRRGCMKIYREKVSAVTAERSQRNRAIGAFNAGDVLIVSVDISTNWRVFVSDKWHVEEQP